MTGDPDATFVAEQYEEWTPPESLMDLAAWVANNWQWFDPSHAHRILWPDRPYKPGLNILVVGCDTTQAAIFAYNNRAAKVVGIDTSLASLNYEQKLKEQYGLMNLELHQISVEEVPRLGLDFDLVVATGILNRAANPIAGMKALGHCLRRDGAIGVVLNSKYGRTGVELLQSFFQDLKLDPHDPALARMANETISMLPADHPVRSYFKIAPGVQSGAGLVGAFLYGLEPGYTVDGCIDLLTSAGLVFQGWLNKGPYYPNDCHFPETEVFAAVNALPETKIWSMMERLNTLNGCHLFMACRPDRPKKSYTIDFSADDCLDYVPVMRMRCGLDDTAIFRPDWRMGLNPTQLPFVQGIDGRRTIRAITACVAQSGELPRDLLADREEFARKLFQSLWRLDFLAMALKPSPSPFANMLNR